MRTLPLEAPDEDIRALVVEWSEHLAAGRFAEALAMFPYTTESFDVEWTPEALENWIANYGFDEPYKDGRRYKLTSLFNLEDPQSMITKSIEVDRENFVFEGPDERDYVGMVHYDDVPLNGKPSDLTARFFIKKVGTDELTLEFLDIHVM